MKELEKLYSKLVKTGKDEPVKAALNRLLQAPNDVDCQIDVVGIAHQSNWLPNRKKALWNVFPIDGKQWINRCVTRVTATSNDLNALCALLNSNVEAVAKIVQTHSPDLVSVWDVNGAKFCGVGLANHQGNQFEQYYYIGWKPGFDTVWRLEFIPYIEAPLAQETQRLDQINGRCETAKGCWAELPYGYGYQTSRQEFATPSANAKPYGYTRNIILHLGYKDEMDSS
jgi:hypothetical protein